MGLLLYVGIVIAIIVIVMIYLIFKDDSKKSKNKPYFLSILALILIVLNLVFYLMVFIPERIGDLISSPIWSIFLPVWIVVSVLGFVTAYKEYNNNRTLAVVNGGLAIINAIAGMLIWAITKM